MFGTVLVANRGEIAVRIIRTLRRLGITSVAVFSDADSGARHVAEADTAVRLGPAPAADSYLSIDRILAAAAATGAEAIHPGYGFLSENAAFAAACAGAGVVFIGPPVPAIEAMGDKIAAKRVAVAAGVPVLPGHAEAGTDDDELARLAREVGFPLLLKPAAGGGGKGMRLLRDAERIGERIAAARREAVAAFGDGSLLLERYVEAPRHIEIQILADTRGTVTHLGERECSLQRRHQKIIEEAPSPLLDAAGRERIGAAAVRLARAVGYTGAGTVEFLVPADRPQEFYFLEMNTRLQVEHPVTELVTGVDLVEQQLWVAAGQPLDPALIGAPITGHAIEARLYAEDPARGFLPTGGRLLAVDEPAGAGVRVDSGMRAGDEVGSHYDPMLAKVIAVGADRSQALRRLDRALAGTTVLGVVTNLGFLRRLLATPAVVAGELDTGLVERLVLPPDADADADAGAGAGAGAESTPVEVYAAAAMVTLLRLQPDPASADPWQLPNGWRLGAPAWTPLRLRVGAEPPRLVSVRGLPEAAWLRLEDTEPVPVSGRWAEQSPPYPAVAVEVAGRRHRFRLADDGAVLWLGTAGRAWPVTRAAGTGAERDATGGAADGAVRSPMPGSVLSVAVTAGAAVAAGQAMLIVEAMKMEHTVTAPVAGTVAALHVRAGQQVRLDQLLAEVAPAEPR